MDNGIQPGNSIFLRGELVSLPEFSHENHGRRFYAMKLAVERLSGYVDTLNVLCPQELLEQAEPDAGSSVAVSGELRSFNNRSGDGSKLVISVLAGRVTVEDGPPENRVQLRGSVCKPGVYRRTPLGREICDVMLAVPRRYRRADYLPVILWGRSAEEAAQRPVGSTIVLSGRLQSREYIKNLPEGVERRTAFEVSVTSAEFFD